MIDLHCHILPNMDDGAVNMKETINMIKVAQSKGFSAAFATSHFIKGSYIQERKLIIQCIKKIKRKLRERHIDFDIFIGNEILLTDDIKEIMDNKECFTLNDSRYLLFELPMNEKVLYLENCLFDIFSNGNIPIMAHPERYKIIQNNPNILVDLINQGMLVQINAGSILGFYGKQAKITAEILLKCNMVHFLASDAHSPNKIYGRFDEVIKKIGEFVSEDIIKDILVINTAKVRDDEYIEIPEPIIYKKDLFEFWRLK